ncbi:MAG: VOC family protein [Microbacterium sp.]|uniref:VOC family protein n=1 Tax=Microbacterium sp. TaxID=51671 RepID=UPI0039E5B280
MALLTPYLHFSGDAREAMTFYASVFGGEPQFMTFGSGGMPGADPDAIMHSYLGADEIELMGSDLPADERFDAFRKNGNITLSLSGPDEARLTELWDALSAGGEITTPLAKAPWGASYGDFIDRFGIRWLVNIGA